MKYESEIIAEILEKRGHKKSSLHYQSECIETWIEETKGAYPKLCDYESEWLNYINENPLGEFPYETITDVTEATINNVVPYAYKSAILKGSTKYRDIDTGEVLDVFEDGRNLELVSVKMPVLTTTGKNLCDINKYIHGGFSSTNNMTFKKDQYRSYYMKCEPSTTYTIRVENSNNRFGVGSSHLFSENTSFPLNKRYTIGSSDCTGETLQYTLTTTEKDRYLYVYTANNGVFNPDIKVQVEEGTSPTSYEPFKSNILTVNEDVTLRSNGSVYDELDLLTGKLTQRIDEDGSVLSQESVKTVDLTITNQDGETLTKLIPFEGTMHISTNGTPIKPTVSMEIPVEAITQNLASFIEEE